MRLSDPNGALVAELDRDALALAVERDGTTVVEPSELPVRKLATELHGVDPTADLTAAVGERRTVEEAYETRFGKARQRRHRAVERTVTWTHPDGAVEVDVRVATDGVAVRYRVRREGRDLLFGDETTLHLPGRAVAWLVPFDQAHEASARQQPVREADGEYCSPGLFRVDDQWVLLCEAGADGDYAAARLVADGGAVSYSVPGSAVNVHFPLETPWRVAVVGDLATVVESTLVTDLAGPVAHEDRSGSDDPGALQTGAGGDWVEPGRVAWSWWSEPGSTDDLDRQREYVAYAAERGWEYVLVDDGWRRERESIPGFVADAAERDVGVFLWAHWTDLNTEAKREEHLNAWADWGVAGIKVDFMNHDDQGRMQFYDRLAEAAGERELLVNFHGSVVPTGLQRRYPHVMTYEGVLGAEYYNSGTLSPAHNCALPFTRNVVGPMDYTPVTFSAATRGTSAGHELALSVVFESGLQHFADGIEAYAARPEAEWFLERVPAAWAETVLVGGHPGAEATIARRANGDDGRRDGEWFMGSITAGPRRTVTADCGFLAGEWTAEVVRDDGDDGLAREQRSVTGTEALDVAVAENGGFVARFTR